MKRVVSLAVAVTVVGLLAGGALAFGQGMAGCGAPMGGHMMGSGPMAGCGRMAGGHMMGHHPMMGAGMPCPGLAGTGTAPEAVTAEKARELAQGYADTYLKGFAVDKVLPFTTPRGTAYSVELKGPADELRTLHVNPWGHVMPFGGPWRRPA